MPINQPPIAEDIPLASWQYEATRILNELEQQLGAAQQRIEELENRGDVLTHDDLRALIDGPPSSVIFYYNALAILGEDC